MRRNGKSTGCSLKARLRAIFRCTITQKSMGYSFTDGEIAKTRCTITQSITPRAVPLHSQRGAPIPTIICGCGGGMLFTRLEGAELDATCTQCCCTITLTPKQRS